jgi:diadenylate cyclase
MTSTPLVIIHNILAIFSFPDISHIRVVDIIDVFLVLILLFQVYNLIKGTAAIKIFIGIIAVYIIWKVVKSFHMHLLTAILGQFISVGVIALIVVFQPEIRQFLLMLGNTRIIRTNPRIFLFWKFRIASPAGLHSDKIVKACQKMAETKTGALIIIARKSELNTYVETGQIIDSKISEPLIETIFFKNSPLHDGAMIIVGEEIRAARCILPISSNPGIPPACGLRHRAAVGITERSDAAAIIVSEQQGYISYSYEGKLFLDVTPSELSTFLEKSFK